MKLNTMVRSLIAAGVITATLGGCAKFDSAAIHSASAAPAATAAASPAVLAFPDFTRIVAQNGAAVVNISVTGKTQETAGTPAFPRLDPNDPFYQFFRQFRIPMPQGQVPVHGVGSGFIVSENGVILTNAHVVANAAEVTVKLTDRREFTAKVVGSDPQTDVAVLKIDAEKLPTVKLHPVDDVKVGEWVVAIGSPYGFENSVTSGIVSAKSRALPDESYVPFIQTDVAVNPGNSGGPLFNMKGEVVGINAQIYTHTGGYQGLAFAIPIGVALNVKEQILAHGSVTRGRIGVTIQEVNQALADSFGLKKPAGALVSSVEKGGPAAKAGLTAGDVILRYNGKEIATSADLPVLVANAEPGSKTRLEVLRDGATRQIDVTVGEMKGEKIAAAAATGEKHGRLGVAVRPLERDEQAQAQVSGGVLVEEAAGPAAAAGIQAGDIILSINSTPVKSVPQLERLLEKAGNHVALLVQRDDSKIFVPVDLG